MNQPNTKPKGTALAVWGVYGRWVMHHRALIDALNLYAPRVFRAKIPPHPDFERRFAR